MSYIGAGEGAKAPFDPQRKRHASRHPEPHLDRSGPRERGRASRVARQGGGGRRAAVGVVAAGDGADAHLDRAAAAKVERERTRELARIGSNLNQIARWANAHKGNAEAVEVIAHLVAIERAFDTLAVRDEPR